MDNQSKADTKIAKPTNDYINNMLSTFPEVVPSETALIVVDMQNATGSRKHGLGKRLTAEGTLEKLAGERFARIENIIVPNLKRVLAFFRENGLRVIYVTYEYEMEDLSDTPPHMISLYTQTSNRKGQLEHEIVEELKPLPGEPVINKTTISAFTSSGIDALLRNMGIKFLVFTGVSTNMCVGTTARDAADRGYRCFLVEDCCGSAQNEHHRAEIVCFQRLFGRVVSADDVMAEIKRNLNK